jgi:hypothetical protein
VSVDKEEWSLSASLRDRLAHTVLASTNKSLARMNKSPDVGKATKRYRPEDDVGEAKNQHTSPAAAE